MSWSLSQHIPTGLSELMSHSIPIDRISPYP